MKFSILTGFILTTMLSIHPAWANVEACVKTYAGELRRIDEQHREGVAITTLHDSACKSENRSLTAGFDQLSKTLIEKIPALSKLSANFNFSNNKQFCSLYDSGKFSSYLTETRINEPVVAAMEQANACFAIFQKNKVVISHESSGPSEVSFTGEFFQPERSLRIAVAKSNDFLCVMPILGKPHLELGSTEVRVDKNFSVICSRTGIKNATTGDETFPQGFVRLLTSDGSYNVSMPQDRYQGLATRLEAEKAIAQANQEASKTQALAAELSKINNFLANRKVTLHGYYIGSSRTEFTPKQEYFSATFFKGKSEEEQHRYIKEKLCPYAKNAFFSERVDNKSGGCCGFNFYILACESSN